LEVVGTVDVEVEVEIGFGFGVLVDWLVPGLLIVKVGLFCVGFVHSRVVSCVHDILV
jgi:hypothetical protein